MKSSDGEEVDFAKEGVVDPNQGHRRGNVEVWMAEVEESMRGSVRMHTMKALHDFVQTVGLPAEPQSTGSSSGWGQSNPAASSLHLEEYAKKREEWSARWPGQVVLAVDQIIWTYGAERVLRRIEKLSRTPGGEDIAVQRDHAVRAMDAYHEELSVNLKAIVRRVRAPLPRSRRTTLSALTTLSVHGRDVVERMQRRETVSVHDFEWYSQLRYYWEEQSSNADEEGDSAPGTVRHQWKGTDGSTVGRGASFETPEAIAWRKS